MIIYAIIRNIESNKDEAVIAHDPKLGRIVFRLRGQNIPLEKALNIHYDRSIIIQEPVEVNGYVILKKRRSIPSDSDYLNNLLDRAVKIPYEVRVINQVTTLDGLDAYIDKLSSDYLDG